MIRTPLIAAAALMIAAPALASDPVPASDGSVALTFEPAAQTGAVMVALYDEANYNGGEPIRAARIDIAAGHRTITFEGVAPGDYGMKAYHDVNGNGRMDANPFGMPTEPFAFSNNARGNFGPAGWDRARFSVDGAVSQTISIR